MGNICNAGATDNHEMQTGTGVYSFKRTVRDKI